MHCILIGITPPGSDGTTWNTVTEQATQIDGMAINWIATSTSHDEGTPVELLCATTDAPAEDIVAAVSDTLGDGHSCEMWATAPAILPLRPPIGYEEPIMQGDDSPDAREDWAASTMREWGMFVQSSLIHGNELEELRKYVDEEISSIEEAIRLRHPEISIGKDVMSFKEIASRGNERFDLLLRQNSPAREFVQNTVLERVSSLLEEILDGRVGEDIDFDISAVYSKPGAPNQGWHADGDHQKGFNDAGWDIHGWKTQLAPPYALCLFIPLIDLDEETGYTQFWPGSHRNRGLAGFGRVAEISDATWDGRCNAGDAIWYDYRSMHRGMANCSQMLRPVIQVLFKKSWYLEKRNYGTESLR